MLCVRNSSFDPRFARLEHTSSMRIRQAAAQRVDPTLKNRYLTTAGSRTYNSTAAVAVDAGLYAIRFDAELTARGGNGKGSPNKTLSSFFEEGNTHASVRA
jgi:hypothetical protein